MRKKLNKPFKISRSKFFNFLSCKRCFYLDRKLKVAQPPGFPFNLNSAVDQLLKNEFDEHRENETTHPYIKELGLNAVPFKHEMMDPWRENFKGVEYAVDDLKFLIHGAVDDVWIKSDGSLIIADVKTTSKKKFDWDDTFAKYDYAHGYKRQIEMYQWLFRKNGFQVANEAYLVYYNALKNEPFFNQILKFKLHLVRLECDDSWVEKKVFDAVNLLKSDEFPPTSTTCENCNYLKKRWNVSQKIN